MKRVFRAEKMIARITEEGRADMLTPEIMEKIRSLDGKVGDSWNWAYVVNDEDLVWIESEQTYVNFADTELV